MGEGNQQEGRGGRFEFWASACGPITGSARFQGEGGLNLVRLPKNWLDWVGLGWIGLDRSAARRGLTRVDRMDADDRGRRFILKTAIEFPAKHAKR